MSGAFVLSAHTIGLGVIRALGEAGIDVVSGYYDPLDMGMVSRFVTAKWLLPHPEEEEKQFVARLLETGKTAKGRVLFPADDATLGAVSRNYEALATCYRLACPGWETVRRYLQKEHTYALAEELGVPAPLTRKPGSVREALEAAERIGYPCLIKPCESHRYFELLRCKMRRVADAGELRAAYEEAVDHQLEVLVQEWIPGGDDCGINYNSYRIAGEPVAEFTAEKVRLSPPGMGVPRVVVSRKIPEVIENGRKILKGLDYNGFSCTEFKRDPRNGVYKFMEVNGRHNRSGMLAVRCGVNFQLMEYEHLTQGTRPSPREFTEGYYWIDDVKDVCESIRSWHRERFSPGELLRPYRSQHVFSVWDRTDPAPMRKRVRDLIGVAFRPRGRRGKK